MSGLGLSSSAHSSADAGIEAFRARRCSAYLKYLKSGAFWLLAVGIRKPSPLTM
jgi:hypothetical protein